MPCAGPSPVSGHLLHLGLKELRALARDRVMLGLIAYVFTVAIYTAATAMPESLNRATLAIVDEDHSPLSLRIAEAFQPPYFAPPDFIDRGQMDARMDAGLDTFALDIPPGFQRDVLAGQRPAIQLNVDATRMSQAFTGTAYVQRILGSEVDAFVRRHRGEPAAPVALSARVRFNPRLEPAWFGSIMELINHITLLGIVLTGAALIREREHGTVEHLLSMPVSPLEIMGAKVWSMGLVVLLGAALSLLLVVQGVLQVPIRGSLGLFLAGTALHLFAATSLGIFLATLARSMPRFGLLLILVLMPLQMLSGGVTPRESMPELVRALMLAVPDTHFVMLAQSILFRGAGLEVVWPQFLAMALIGLALFLFALARFRRAIAAPA